MVGGRGRLPPANMEITSKRYEAHSFKCGECGGGRSRPHTLHTPTPAPQAPKGKSKKT
ncbi:hypothetical protein KDK_56630 [Dictyobacter kobayashii]|uniref:Uncharacterized protein n=1 Tax=Dictyobacter kobayashii TaxID=2014872 RepID=A0A402AS33_9CHLR|nr:hypothetical protein KDK_56630 [Dictyobacter kobayashii]